MEEKMKRAILIVMAIVIGLASSGRILEALAEDIPKKQEGLDQMSPVLKCTTDQVAKFDGDRWTCTANPSVQLETLEARVAALEELLVHFNRSGNVITISGANLQVVNGEGSTVTSNGLGNVIIGYNEARQDGSDDRSGSHMLVVGQENNYTGYGGIVVGLNNETSGGFAVVSGGKGNVASGNSSSVSGGHGNIAGGTFSSVSSRSIKTLMVRSSSMMSFLPLIKELNSGWSCMTLARHLTI